MIAGVVCFLAAWLARDYGVRWYWLAAIFTGLQPEFFKLGYSCLTELVFALLLCGTFLAYQKRNWAAMALIAGWLPLARYESLPLILFLVVPLWRVRRLGLLPWLVAPLLVQNVCNAIETHNVTGPSVPNRQGFGLQCRCHEV